MSVRLAILAVLALPAVVHAQETVIPWANKLFSGKLEHDFGKVARDAKPSHAFLMKNIYKTTLHISDPVSNCGCSTARVTKKILKPEETAEVIVTVDGARVDGPKYARIQVTVGPEFVSTATLYVSVEPAYSIQIEPRVVDFGLVPRGEERAKSVQIKAKDAGWKILSLGEPKGSALVAKLDESEKGVYRVQVTFKGTAPAGLFREELTLKTNDKEMPILTLPVQATVQGTLTVTPEILVLDEIKVGTEVSRRFVVRGSKPFRVTKADGLGKNVTIKLPEAPAAVHILEIRVQPTAPGMFRREIRLQTDLDGESVELVVEGKGA